MKTNVFKSKARRERTMIVISFILILLFAFIVILPLYWMVRSALLSNANIFKWPLILIPVDWKWSNFNISANAFDFWRYLGNTLTIVIPCVVFGTTTAVFCGYAFARLRFRGKNFLFALCIGSMLLPGMVTLIPLYVVWAKLGFVDTYLPLILPYFCGGGAFNIFLLRQFIRTIPKELDEAATIDGAGYMRTLISVLVPSIRAAIIVVALLIFITTYNDLLQQMIYIHSQDKRTIIVGLTAFMGSFKTDYAGMFAATVLAFIPGLVVYLFGQRYFVEGIVMTGLKS